MHGVLLLLGLFPSLGQHCARCSSASRAFPITRSNIVHGVLLLLGLFPSLGATLCTVSFCFSGFSHHPEQHCERCSSASRAFPITRSNIVKGVLLLLGLFPSPGATLWKVFFCFSGFSHHPEQHCERCSSASRAFPITRSNIVKGVLLLLGLFPSPGATL